MSPSSDPFALHVYGHAAHLVFWLDEYRPGRHSVQLSEADLLVALPARHFVQFVAPLRGAYLPGGQLIQPKSYDWCAA